jgi:hypothetical protein
VQDNLDVVDHQIENDVDIQAATGEGPEPIHLDEDRRADHRERGHDRRVVPFDVADRQHPPLRPRESHERVRLREARRHRLLHEDVHAPLEQEGGDLGMRGGRGRDDRGLGLRGHGGEVRKDSETELRGDLARPTLVVIVDPDDLDAGGGRRDPRVMAAEVAHPDHGQTNAFRRAPFHLLHSVGHRRLDRSPIPTGGSPSCSPE